MTETWEQASNAIIAQIHQERGDLVERGFTGTKLSKAEQTRLMHLDELLNVHDMSRAAGCEYGRKTERLIMIASLAKVAVELLPPGYKGGLDATPEMKGYAAQVLHSLANELREVAR